MCYCQSSAKHCIFREIPRLSDEDFEKLDVLSGGKLRHLLVGSPSGYEWSETVETILQHEAKLDEKDGIVTDPKMLPKEQRKQVCMLTFCRRKLMLHRSTEFVCLVT